MFLSLAPKHFCQAHALGNELGYTMIFYMHRRVKYTFISPSSADQVMSLVNRMTHARKRAHFKHTFKSVLSQGNRVE
jgi:hypothetical protein